MAKELAQRRIAAILVADVVGYSPLMQVKETAGEVCLDDGSRDAFGHTARYWPDTKSIRKACGRARLAITRRFGQI
jgi:hypothetical protein